MQFTLYPNFCANTSIESPVLIRALWHASHSIPLSDHYPLEMTVTSLQST